MRRRIKGVKRNLQNNGKVKMPRRDKQHDYYERERSANHNAFDEPDPIWSQRMTGIRVADLLDD